MDKLKRLLKKTPPVPLGIAGALLFLLLFYTLAFRTPLWQVWMPPNIDNDEVIYNRQVVSVITHGGPLGYFGYNEGTADIGRYGAWGPVLIWVYGLAGRLFGASVNTMFWCNVLFLALGVVVFTVAARLNIGQQILCYSGLVCLWMPLAGSFCGSSEAVHFMLALVIVTAIFPQAMLSIYTNEAALITESVPSVYVICCAMLIASVANVVFNGISGTGNTQAALLLETITILIYGSYIIFIGMWLKAPIEWCFTIEIVYYTLLFITSYIYLKKAKWQNKKI